MKRPLPSRTVWRSLLALPTLLLLSAAADGAATPITATFDEGAASFPAAAGNGWTEGWVVQNGNSNASQHWAEVRTASPLNSGGAYLSIGHRSGTGGPYLDWLKVRRRFDGSTGVDLHQPYKVSFDFRAGFVGYNELNGGLSWLLSATGNGATWRFRSRNLDQDAWIDTGIVQRNDGRTFRLEVSIDPSSEMFNATLTQGASSFTTGWVKTPGSFNVNRGEIAYASQGEDSYGSFFSLEIDNVSVAPAVGASGSSASPSHYYVATPAAGGNDWNDGSAGAPWATLARAFSAVPVNQGKTIHVGAGTHVLGGTLAVPAGVSVIGAGVGVTTLLGGLTVTQRDEVTIADLSLDGNNYATNCGIFVRDAFKITLRDLALTRFNSNALSIQRVNQSRFSRLTITDSSYSLRVVGQNRPQTQAISVGQLDDCVFSQLSVNTRDGRGGEAFGTNDEMWNPNIPIYNNPPTFMRNLVITQSTFVVEPYGAWGTGQSPQMCIEFWNVLLTNVDVSYNTFNNCTSVAPGNPDCTNVRAHHNTYMNPIYACEVDIHNFEFDHNIVDGGYYALGYFGAGTRRNLKVHHNVFRNNLAPAQLVNFKAGTHDNFQFVNNTIYITQNAKLFSIPYAAANQRIANNVFISTVGTVPFLDTGTPAFGIDNNFFQGTSSSGTNALTGDAGLALAGIEPDPFYRPLASSPLIDAGVLLAGVNDRFAGARPDIGSVEFGTGITREYWTGLGGAAISTLTSAADYPNSPTGRDTLQSLRATDWNDPAVTAGWAEGYGQRLRGFITAPATGPYTFWIAGDDNAEIWLSTDDNPANRVRIAFLNTYSGPDVWTAEANQRSSANAFTFNGGAPGAISLVAGRRYYVEILHKEATGGDHLSVGWRKPTDGPGAVPVEIVPGDVLTPWIAPPGRLTREYWTGLPGTSLASLTGAPGYPLAPTGRDTIRSGRATDWTNPVVTRDWGNDYGQRVRGFLTAPASGDYMFWIAGDDNCELWLSPDDQPASRVRIAQVNTWANPDEWTREPGQRSSANSFSFNGGSTGVITLTAGRRYYLEILHKEAGGGDNLSVAWRKPTDGAGSAPAEILPASALAPYGD